MAVSRLGVHDSVRAVCPPATLAEHLRDVDATVSVVDDDVSGVDAVVTFSHVDAFVGLDWVHCIRAGYDDFPLDAYRDAGTVVTNSTGIHGTSVGETALGLMLSLARRLHEYRDAQAEQSWTTPAWDAPFTLRDERLTVVGLGTLGRGIATRADAIGMRVDGVRRTPTRTPHTRTVYTPDRLHEAIADARFVAVAVPLTDATRGLIDADALAAMRDDAYLVNVARGAVVDENALIAALNADDLAGAALDVFETEPLPESSPLWDLDDVLVTPHAAPLDRAYPAAVARIVRTNLRRDDGADVVNRVV